MTDNIIKKLASNEKKTACFNFPW